MAPQLKLVIAVGVGDFVILVVNDHWYVFEHNGKVVLIDVFQARLILLFFLEMLEADEVHDGENGEDEVKEIEYLFSVDVVGPFEVVPRKGHSTKITRLLLHNVRAVVAVHADVEVIDIEDDEPHY